MSDLEAVYQSEGLNTTISRADLWALLGIWAVQQTIDKSNDECDDCDNVPDLDVEFQWGRQVGTLMLASSFLRLFPHSYILAP